MPTTIGQFFQAQAKKAGVTFNEEQIAFLNGGEVGRIIVPDDITTALDNNLLSIADAKNNHPDIKNHYTKATLDGVDGVITELLKDLTEEDKAEILGERSSYKRITLTANKLRALEAKKAGATKPEQKEIQAQIDALHAQLAAEKKAKEDLTSQHQQQLRQFQVDAKLEGLLAGYKTIYDTLPAEVRNMTLKNLLQKELQDKDADLTIDDKGNLVILKKDGSSFYGENHQLVNPVQLAEQTFSRNKLLQVTPPAGDTARPNPAQPAGGDSGKDTNHTLKQLAAEAKKSYTNGSAAAV